MISHNLGLSVIAAARAMKPSVANLTVNGIGRERFSVHYDTDTYARELTPFF